MDILGAEFLANLPSAILLMVAVIWFQRSFNALNSANARTLSDQTKHSSETLRQLISDNAASQRDRDDKFLNALTRERDAMTAFRVQLNDEHKESLAALRASTEAATESAKALALLSNDVNDMRHEVAEHGVTQVKRLQALETANHELGKSVREMVESLKAAREAEVIAPAEFRAAITSILDELRNARADVQNALKAQTKKDTGELKA